MEALFQPHHQVDVGWNVRLIYPSLVPFCMWLFTPITNHIIIFYNFEERASMNLYCNLFLKDGNPWAISILSVRYLMWSQSGLHKFWKSLDADCEMLKRAEIWYKHNVQGEGKVLFWDWLINNLLNLLSLDSKGW